MNPDDSFQDPNDTINLPLNLRPAQPLLNLIHDPSSTNVSPLEQDVLDEYSRVLANMNELSSLLQDLAAGPTTVQIAESLRLLERKVASVYTLMKASVYSIVLQQGEGAEGG